MSTIDFFNSNRLTVIPVVPRSKKPKSSGWQKRCVEQNDASEFSHQSNFGVVLGDASDGLVDIDLDSDLSRTLAPHFLPDTGWIFGRASSPRSHWIYRTAGDAGDGRKFNVHGKFAEYRANGQMTVFPPSTHASGEPIEFNSVIAVGSSTREELQVSLTLMSITALVIPHYREGMRNDIALALSGMLLRHGLSEKEVYRLVEALCNVMDDEEKYNRLEAVVSTSARQEKDQPYTQENRLAELIGRDEVEAIRALLGCVLKPQFVSLQSQGGFLLQDDMNDSGIAKLFANQVRPFVIFDVDSDSFAVYQDGIWTPEPKGLQIAEVFDQFVLKQIEVLSQEKYSAHEQYLFQTKFLRKYRDRSKAQAALSQARSYLRSAPGQFDKQDHMLALANGVIDLRSGTLHPHSPKNYFTKRLNVAFDPSADCPLFKAALSDAFGGDEQLISYFKGIAGYWLTGSTEREEFFFLHGSGGNGKSKLLNAIADVMGPYSGTMMGETIFEGSSNQYMYDLASLRGCRLAVVHEGESKSPLHAARVKQITGQDTIKVRQLYKDPISFTPRFKMVVICNKRPNIDAYDDALKRRIKMIPFENVIPPEKRDLKFAQKLRLEYPGILNFLLEGAQMYFRNEISEPHAVTRASDDYFSDFDSVGGFLSACTLTCPGMMVGKGCLYEAYVSYCTEEAMLALSIGQFGKVMKKKGFEDARSSDKRSWKNLHLIEQVIDAAIVKKATA